MPVLPATVEDLVTPGAQCRFERTPRPPLGCSATCPVRGGHGRGSLIRVLRQASLSAMALTERDRAILDFERSWWTETGPKDTAIRARFELSGTRYYQLLAELVDDPEALDYDPLLVRRLRRVRDRRRRARVEGRPMSQLDGR